MTLIWLRGLFSTRQGRLIGTALGIAATVALFASITCFIVTSAATMTRRALADVAVDWQILVRGAVSDTRVAEGVRSVTPYDAIAPLTFADVRGLSASTNGTIQTTGAGVVVGMDERYRAAFPSQVRRLAGAVSGVLVAQQTAANLRVRVGDVVTIARRVGRPVDVTVDGVVDLPNADSLFAAIGVPASAAPQAPPDNVVIVPTRVWLGLFGAQARAEPKSIRRELHVRILHDLPSDPGAAALRVTQLAHRVEALFAGDVAVADNLAARLNGVRSDALYARVLFLFLGLPGIVVAGLLTLAVASSGEIRRRREQALLRIRGATRADIIRLASLEAAIVGIAGALAGVVTAALFARALGWFGIFDHRTLPWTLAAAVLGFALAQAAIGVPALRDATRTAQAARRTVERGGAPLWRRLYLDVVLLIVAFAAFAQMAATGYQVVLAPEGVPESSVQYQAFVAPVFFWVGATLLCVRLAEWFFGRPDLLERAIHPLAANLSPVVAATLSRSRLAIMQGLALIVLAFAFAASTAIFNTTYNAQERVDAQLTNGADLAVTGSTANPASRVLAAIRGTPGVAAVALLQHRFAYVGNDLQDLFGIDAAHIGEATTISDAFFSGATAAATMRELDRHDDGLLLSAETVKDFALTSGDRVNLRMQFADGAYHTVPFRFVGVAREFPSAPKDSFLVANARYVSRMTGVRSAETVLARTSGDPSAVAARLRATIGAAPGMSIRDITEVEKAIGSSLTAVDLGRLTRLESAFAVAFVAGATGLMLLLSLIERRRSFAILTALGAGARQVSVFIWAEAIIYVVGGVVFGLAIGTGVALMLVKLLTGVFDPPPESLVFPLPYLVTTSLAAVASVAIATGLTISALRRGTAAALRDM
jgi:putative ABC transport system permease protein